MDHRLLRGSPTLAYHLRVVVNAGYWRFVLLLWLLAAQIAASAQLKPETLEGFKRYVAATEQRIDRQVSNASGFLYLDELPSSQREEAMAKVKRGEIWIQKLETRDASGRAIPAPGGLIHHWLADVFIPGASMHDVLAVVQDYNHHQATYQPDVVRSRLLSHQDGEYRIFLRFREHKVITVTLDTEHEVHYGRLDDAHWFSRSASTRIAQVDHADTPQESEEPPDQGGGFLWRINSYWRFVERDGGVYVECESISLTRDIPLGLNWLIGPFLTSIPKESLERTLNNTRVAVLARLKHD